MASPHPPSLDELLSSQLARRKERHLFRSLEAPANEQGLVDFSSNDYLSLSKNPEIRHEYISFLQQHQPQQIQQGQLPNSSPGAGGDDFRLGSGGSRLLDGNSSLAERLERSLAGFHGYPAGLLFNSGYEANTGLFSAVPQAGDVVVYDEFIHASVHSGMKLSRARRTVQFRHNSVWADDEEEEEEEEDPDDELSCGARPLGAARGAGPVSLDETLRRVLEDRGGGEEVREGRRHVFVAVEAVYSMDGDLAPLHDIVKCVERRLPRGNGHVVVDEAHSNGVFGPGGRGLVCELGLEKRIWATVLTFGKAMGCSGAIVLCTPATRSYLINYARTFIYTTAMGFPSLASIQVAHNYVARGRADAARRRLFALAQHMRARLAALCSSAAAAAAAATHNTSSSSSSAAAAAALIDVKGWSTTTTEPSSPILPVFTPKARSLAAFCRRRGFVVRPIVAPTVPLGTDRVRICLHAGNSLEECEGLCAAVEEWVRGQLRAGGRARSEAEDQDGQDVKSRL